MKRRNWTAFALVALLLPGVALAAAKRPTLHVEERIEIAAAPAAVWKIVRDWNGLHTWHPAFSNDVIKKGNNNEKGAIRTLTLKDGGATFDEELLAFNDRKHSYKYRIITDSPLPVADYVSTVQVKPGKKKGTSVLIWKGSFKRKVADNPPAGQDDAGAKQAISGAYRAGLENVTKMAEGK